MKLSTLHDVLTGAGFRRDVLYPGCNVYERHSGAFTLQVVHVPSDDQVRLNLAFRPSEGQPPMTFRPWSLPVDGADAVVREALHFLRVVEPTQCGGD